MRAHTHKDEVKLAPVTVKIRLALPVSLTTFISMSKISRPRRILLVNEL